MTPKQTGHSNGLEKMTSLLAWWGIPNSNGNGHIEAQLKRFQSFASEMQKVSAEAFSGEMSAMQAARERALQAFQDLVRSRTPEEFFAAESNIMSTYLDEMSLQAKRWADITERAHACCTALSRDLAEEAGSSKSFKSRARSEPRPDRTAAKETHRHGANT